MSEEWRNHIPSGYEDQSGYGQLSCSCGWDSSDTLGWEQHINAALSEPASTGLDCDFCLDSIPAWHEITDPEGIEGTQRIPCPRAGHP